MQQEKELQESDFRLYWAMVNDHIIERDPEIEKQYEAFVAALLK